MRVKTVNNGRVPRFWVYESIESFQRKPRQAKPEREDAANAANATFMSEKEGNIRHIRLTKIRE